LGADCFTAISERTIMTAPTITQADRDAAKSIEWVRTTIDDQNAIAQAFAAHRELGARKERAAVVAWLVRHGEGDLSNNCHVMLAAKSFGSAIERGEHSAKGE